MKRGKPVLMVLAIWTVSNLVFGGCGSDGKEVTFSNQDPDSLRILEILPHDGEKNVPINITAVVVFSDDVQFDGDTGGTDLAKANPNTIKIVRNEGNGTVSNFAVVPSSASDGSKINNTARISLDPNNLLAKETTYLIVVKATIKGAKTEPIGVEIETSFTTGTGSL
jgi:hypothetical protein